MSRHKEVLAISRAVLDSNATWSDKHKHVQTLKYAYIGRKAQEKADALRAAFSTNGYNEVVVKLSDRGISVSVLVPHSYKD